VSHLDNSLPGFMGAIVTIQAVGAAFSGLGLKLNKDASRRINVVENRLSGVESRLAGVEKGRVRMEGYLARMQILAPPAEP